MRRCVVKNSAFGAENVAVVAMVGFVIAVVVDIASGAVGVVDFGDVAVAYAVKPNIVAA